MLLRRFLEGLVEPLGLALLLLVTAGLASRRRSPRLARAALVAAGLVLYLASTPFVARLLHRGLEGTPALDPASLVTPRADAIVVVGAGRSRDAPDYGGDTVSFMSLERVRYAARLARATGLPVLASGGAPDGKGVPEGTVMAQALKLDFGIEAARLWVESRSRTTWENAVESASLLERHGARRVYLVTHAWHMPRTLAAFCAQGIQAIPAPTAFSSVRPTGASLLREWLPNAFELWLSERALHEYLGSLWYRLRHPGFRPGATCPVPT